MTFDSTKFDSLYAENQNAVIGFIGTSNDTAPNENESFTNQGLLSRLSFKLEDILASDGLISNRTASLQDRVDQIDKDRERFNTRIGRLEDRLFKQFSALDASLARLQQTQSLLSQRLGALNQLQKE